MSFIFKVFHPFYHGFVKRDSFYPLLSLYRKSQYWNPDRILEFQFGKFIELISHAIRNTEYYKGLFLKNDIDISDLKTKGDLKKIPFLTKNIVRENFNSLISKNSAPGRIIPNSTSGSTGENFKFYSDKKGDIHRAVIPMRNDEWMGLEIGHKTVSLWGAPFDVTKYKKIKKRIKNYFKNHIILLAYNMTNDNMMNYYEIIKRFRPDVINGYPSTLFEFSEFLKNSSLKFSGIKAIRSQGETLYDFQRKSIEEIFGCKVFNMYSSRDVTLIAHECKYQNGLHIMSENVFLEVVDKNDNPVLDEEGEIVLTDLHNYVMPFIRYKIGDRGILSRRKCECGVNLPILEKVTGRTMDLISFPNGNQVGGTFWTLLMRSIEGIEKFQVVQEENGAIIINYITNDDFAKNSIPVIRERVIRKGGDKTDIEFIEVPEIPKTPGGKHRFVVSRKKS